MKGLKWLYLAIYSAFVLLTIAMSAITETGSLVIYFQMVILLIPSFVLMSDLIGKVRHVTFSIIGIIALLPVLADAHKFSGFSVVTQAMYALFLPMLVYLAINLYGSRGADT
jgi:hypothetical protein